MPPVRREREVNTFRPKVGFLVDISRLILGSHRDDALYGVWGYDHGVKRRTDMSQGYHK